MNITDAQARDLLDAVEGRTLKVHMSRALERRLEAYAGDANAAMANDPLEQLGEWIDLDPDEELAWHLVTCAEIGLRSEESRRGVWSDGAGRIHHLPRTRRARWTLRLKWAMQEAVQTWRSL